MEAHIPPASGRSIPRLIRERRWWVALLLLWALAIGLYTHVHVAQMRERLQAAGPTCVFSEPPLRPRLAQTLSAGLPVTLAELDARYTLETDAGDLVYVQNRALRSGPAELMAQLARGERVAGTTRDLSAMAELKTRYAFVAEHDMSMTSSTPESDEMAADSPAMYDRVRLGHMSLAIAMVLAAGVRKNNIRSALHVANNLN